MKIDILEPLSVSKQEMDQFKRTFTSRGHEVITYNERNEKPDEIIKRCSGADIAVIANLPFPREVITALPDLKMIAVAFTGTDHIDRETCRKRNIIVSNASGYSSINVAELTVGLMIDLLRNITKLDPVTRRGGTRTGFNGFDLAGKTVGIIGTGEIGLRVAKNLSGFDVNLLAWSRTERKEARKYGITYTDLDTLLKESDIVTLHIPLTEKTKGLINADKIKIMKQSACIINCARGPVIRSKDLAEALQEKRIAGAALDVFDTEPPLPRNNPFLSLDNVVLTPHIAYATEEAFSRRLRIVEKNIEAFIAGNPVNVVN